MLAKGMLERGFCFLREKHWQWSKRLLLGFSVCPFPGQSQSFIGAAVLTKVLCKSKTSHKAGEAAVTLFLWHYRQPLQITPGLNLILVTLCSEVFWGVFLDLFGNRGEFGTKALCFIMFKHPVKEGLQSNFGKCEWRADTLTPRLQWAEMAVVIHFEKTFLPAWLALLAKLM